MRKKVAVITGGTSSIGEAICRAMYAFNKQIILIDIDKERGNDIASQVDGYFIHADLTNPNDCKLVIEQTIRKFKGIDILINNAEMHYKEEIENFPLDKWEQMVSLMLTAPFLLTKHALPNMKERGWGRIINIASVLGLIASPLNSAYTSAKHGLIGFTRSAALESGKYGITVNAICPAYVKTPSIEEKVLSLANNNGMSNKQVIEHMILGNTAINELIKPEEVADLTVFLSSEKARSITGSEFSIDLGLAST